MALFYDVTKSAGSKQLSGLVRVSEKLGQALSDRLGGELVPVVWHQRRRTFHELDSRTSVDMSPAHHFLTPEVFSSENRPGFYEALSQSGVISAAVFHDAIPYLFPEITWPKSVARHPLYMRNIAGLDCVFSVSGSSQGDLEAFWSEIGVTNRPNLSTITLGANFFDRADSGWTHAPGTMPSIVNVGIIEPRKNQLELLEIACRLWDAGNRFELHFVGRINPHFGKPIAKAIRRAKKAGYAVYLHSKQSDAMLLELYSKAHFTVFNSITEGFGLPVVESLWLGIPCVMRKLPSLDSFVDEISLVSVDSEETLSAKMSEWLSHSNRLARAAEVAVSRSMPTWDRTVDPILEWKAGR